MWTRACSKYFPKDGRKGKMSFSGAAQSPWSMISPHKFSQMRGTSHSSNLSHFHLLKFCKASFPLLITRCWRTSHSHQSLKMKRDFSSLHLLSQNLGKKALTHCGFTGKLFGSHLALPSLIVSLICSRIRLISMFLTYYSQIHSSGWCDRFTNSFIKEMLQVYLVVFLLFQPISSY